jgi:hypothetical protein
MAALPIALTTFGQTDPASTKRVPSQWQKKNERKPKKFQLFSFHIPSLRFKISHRHRQAAQ